MNKIDEIDYRVKALEDRFQDLLQIRDPDALIVQVKELGQYFENFKEKIQKLQTNVNEFMHLSISDDLLHTAWKRSGLGLKHLAAHVGLDTINLAQISRLVNGELKDKNKRLAIYLYCLREIEKQFKPKDEN